MGNDDKDRKGQNVCVCVFVNLTKIGRITRILYIQNLLCRCVVVYAKYICINVWNELFHLNDMAQYIESWIHFLDASFTNCPSSFSTKCICTPAQEIANIPYHYMQMWLFLCTLIVVRLYTCLQHFKKYAAVREKHITFHNLIRGFQFFNGLCLSAAFLTLMTSRMLWFYLFIE